MRKLFSQHKRMFQKITGYFLIPFLLIVSDFIFDMTEVNFTGIINHPDYGNMMKLPCLLIWIYLNWLSYEQTHIPHKKKWFLCTSIIAICAIFIPYTSPSAFSSNLHVLFSNIAFLLFNGIILYSDLYDSRKLTIYFIMILPSIILCTVSLSVTGISEIAYTLGISIYLTLFAK